jgi:hypothetical protein
MRSHDCLRGRSFQAVSAAEEIEPGLKTSANCIEHSLARRLGYRIQLRRGRNDTLSRY